MNSRDKGSATVLSLALICVLLLAGSLTWAILDAALAHRRAGAAADLSAIAGALANGDACTAAFRVAQANAAHLESCDVDGRDVTVTVSVAPSPVVAWIAERAGAPTPRVTSSARAGPSG